MLLGLIFTNNLISAS